MELDLKEQDGVSILVLEGQLAAGEHKQFRQAMDTLIDSGRTSILLDFTEVSFMDSLGIGELIGAYRTVEKLGGALKILKPGKKIHQTLEITKLLPIFEIFDDLESAIASYSPPG